MADDDAAARSPPLLRWGETGYVLPSFPPHMASPPLLHIGERAVVPPSGYVRPVISEGRWKDTLYNAESEAMRQANDLLHGLRDGPGRGVLSPAGGGETSHDPAFCALTGHTLAYVLKHLC